jgi:gas vesicle protein
LFGYHVTGSTGALFLYGIVVGGIAIFGLSVLLAGARRTSRRGRTARRTLQQSRRETAAVSQDRDDMVNQRDAARAETASALGNGTAPSDHQVSSEDSSEDSPEVTPADDHRSRWQRFGHRAAPEQATDTDSVAPADQAAPDVPVAAE